MTEMQQNSKRAIWSETIRWPSVWIKTNHRNIEGIHSKGKKCNKNPGPIQNGSAVKSNERIWLGTSAADKSWTTWLCKLYLRTPRRDRSRRCAVPFHLTYEYIPCILFIFSSDFLPLVHFVPFLKSHGTMPLSAGLGRREPFSCTRLLFLIIISIFYTYPVLFFNTFSS